MPLPPDLGQSPWLHPQAVGLNLQESYIFIGLLDLLVSTMGPFLGLSNGSCKKKVVNNMFCWDDMTWCGLKNCCSLVYPGVLSLNFASITSESAVSTPLTDKQKDK